jgi:hypothetical protein
MKEIEKNAIIKLKDKPHNKYKVLNLPTSYMANGSYEVVQWIDNGLGSLGNPFWVKPEEIEDTQWDDDIENYFHIIYDEEGLHIVPKNIDLVKLTADEDGSKKIVMDYPDTKHKTVTFYIGDTKIVDDEELTDVPEKEKLTSKISKVILGED